LTVIDSLLSLVLSLVPCCILGAIPAGFIAIAAALLMVSSRVKAGFGKGLGSLAAECGLEMRGLGKSESPRAEGVYRGRKVLVEMMTVEVGSSGMDDERPMRVNYTKAQAWHKGKVNRMLVRRESIKCRMEKTFAGAKDVELGLDAAFDKAYMVSVADEAQAKLVFDAGIQATMVSLSRLLREVLVEGDGARCLMIGVVSDPKELRRLLELAVDIAELAEKPELSRG
jgi:hypothetical protein